MWNGVHGVAVKLDLEPKLRIGPKISFTATLYEKLHIKTHHLTDPRREQCRKPHEQVCLSFRATLERRLIYKLAA